MLMDAYISINMQVFCNTGREESGRAGGAAALPRSPQGNCPSVVHACGRAEGEKGATGEPVTPS